jgi:hypothetical protein
MKEEDDPAEWVLNSEDATLSGRRAGPPQPSKQKTTFLTTKETFFNILMSNRNPVNP